MSALLLDYALDRRGHVELYRQVSDKLRVAIEQGAWPAGHRLPPETELALLFNVSPKTISNAYGVLVDEGLLLRRRPKGTFVASAELLAAQHRSGTVAAFLSLAGMHLWGRVVRGLSCELHRHGYDLSLKDFSDWPAAEYRRHVAGACAGDAAGVILYPHWAGLEALFYRELSSARAPVLMINYGADIGLEAVATEEAVGIDGAVRHLYGLGHRRLGYVDWPSATPRSMPGSVTYQWHVQVRKDAFLAACGQLGVAAAQRTAWSCLTGDERDDVAMRRQLRVMLQAPHRPTGIVCFNDLVALSLWTAAEESGLRVPEDLSIVGYDNETLGGFSACQLTTVDPDWERLGVAAARRMAALSRGSCRRPEPEGTLLLPKLIVRHSTAPPAERSRARRVDSGDRKRSQSPGGKGRLCREERTGNR